MIQELGDILMEQLKDLPFIDKYAGVVKVITISKETGGTQSLPISVKADHTSKDLVLDSKKKSVIYLEDRNGLKFDPEQEDHGGIKITGTIDLVMWFNLKLLNSAERSYAAKAIAMVYTTLANLNLNESPFGQIQFSISGTYPINYNPYAKYTIYQEEKSQYLMYPYDYCALSIDVSAKLLKCTE